MGNPAEKGLDFGQIPLKQWFNQQSLHQEQTVWVDTLLRKNVLEKINNQCVKQLVVSCIEFPSMGWCATDMFLEYSALSSSIGQETWSGLDSLDNFLQFKRRHINQV